MQTLACWMLLLRLNGVEASLAPSDRLAQDTRARAVVRISEMLRRSLDELRATSPTFRAQWQAVTSTSSLVLTIELTSLPMRCRAQTRFRRYAAGVVYARMLIGDRTRAPELIAHELEHVREYLEGFRLIERATPRTMDAWVDSKGRIETSRALGVEHVVKQELNGARRAFP